MAITIIAVIAAVVMPQFRDHDRLRVMAAVQILASDIEAAQVLTISFPDDPVVVRFNPAKSTYWLADIDTPDTPLTHPASGEPYLVVLGQGRASGAQNVTLTLTNMPDNTITFNSDGGLADFTTVPIVSLRSGDEAVELLVAPTTGTVMEREPGSGAK